MLVAMVATPGLPNPPDSTLLQVNDAIMFIDATVGSDAADKVRELNDANTAGIQKEKERLLQQYLSTYQSLSGSAAAAAASTPVASVSGSRAQLPNRYISFEDFCNGMNLSGDMRARCRTAWQEGGGMKTIATKLGNIIGKIVFEFVISIR